MKDSRIRLFLSYGHDSKNKRIIDEVIRVLREEFEVWIDNREIDVNEDWRREIVKGIYETELTVGLLSEYSMRERGVCLDELGISVSIPGRKLVTILLENQSRVSIPTTITRNQWLDLSEWEKYIDTDQWNDYFEPKKELLFACIKSRENYAFQGEISILYKVLKPEPFNSKASLYINSTSSVARPWLIEQVNEWTQDPSSGRFLLITGDAGTGKSHFSAMFQHYNPICAAGAFFEHGKVNPDYVKDMIRYLIYTLATRFPDYRRQLLELFRMDGLIDENDTVREVKCAEYFTSHTAESLFDRFMCIPVIGGTNTNAAIILDGLDELSTGEGNPMIDFLCSDHFAKLPPNYKFIITTRPEPSIMASLQAVRFRRIDLNSGNSDADIEKYIRKRLASAAEDHHLTQEAVNTLVERSSRMFLYAELACDAILESGFSANEIIEMPAGMSGLFCRYFDRLFPDLDQYETVKPFLRVICAFDIGLLSEAFLAYVTGTGPEALNRFYLLLRSFAQSRVIEGKAYVFLFHKSLYDWFTDRTLSGKYYIDTSAGRHMIAGACREIARTANVDSDYEFLKNTYFFTVKHGHEEQLSHDVKMLYELQWCAYNRTDAEMFNEAAERVQRISRITGNKKLYILSRFCLACWIFDVLMDEEKALELVNDLLAQYPGEIRSDPELFAVAELDRIYMVNTHHQNYEQSLGWIDSLLTFIQSCSEEQLPTKNKRIAQVYYHRCIIEYRLRRYNDCIRSAEYASEAAEYGYNDPRKLRCLIYITQGAAYKKTGEFSKALEVLHKSLEYRLSLYGFYTFYTANAYNNLIMALYEKAVKTGADFDPIIYEYLENYRKILISVAGEKSPRLIGYYITMANICDKNGQVKKAAAFAAKALQFKTNRDDAARKTMEQIIQKAQNQESSL